MAKDLDGQVEGFPHQAVGHRSYIPSLPPTRSSSRCGASRTVDVYGLLATVNAAADREMLGCTPRPPKIPPAGWRSSVRWSPAACPSSAWSPPTLTAAWST
jgi:hypothetical protein